MHWLSRCRKGYKIWISSYLIQGVACLTGPVGYVRPGVRAAPGDRQFMYTCWSAFWMFWLGLLANLTVSFSVPPSGIVSCRSSMAFCASMRLSNRTKPTPRGRPAVKTEKKNSLILQMLSLLFPMTNWSHCTCDSASILFMTTRTNFIKKHKYA